MPEFDGTSGQSADWYGSEDPNAYHMTPAESEAYRAKRKGDLFKGLGLTVGGMLMAGPASKGLSALFTGGGTTIPAVAQSGMAGYPTASMVSPAASSGGGLLGKLGKLFGSNLFGKVVEGAFGVYGQKQANKQLDRAAAAQADINNRTLALQQQQIDDARRAADLDRADALKATEAMNELKRRELAASEEERAFTRAEAERQRQLRDERELRLAPRRQMSDQALAALMGMFGGK